jgi:hypothetical protein
MGLGDDHAAPVMIVGGSLRLNGLYASISLVKTLDVSSAPYFVITPLQDDPILVSAYRGQDFTWRQTPLWNTSLPQDWIRWAALREMPQTGEAIILWARDDLFLDSASKLNP